MKRLERILLLDDSPDERALIIRELRRAFPEVQIEEILEPNAGSGSRFWIELSCFKAANKSI